MHLTSLSVCARFKVLWSVFQTHSKAEDDYIWPKLHEKMGDTKSSHNNNNKTITTNDTATHTKGEVGGVNTDSRVGKDDGSTNGVKINEEDYEEDHEEEERMFKGMNGTLEILRKR